MKTMHRTALMVAAIILILPLSVRSEIRAGSFEVSPFGGYNLFEERQNLDDHFVFGARIGYNFTENFGLEGVGEFIKTGVDDETEAFTHDGEFTRPIEDVDISFYHLDLLYHFIPEGVFNPFIAVGYGAAHYSPEVINDTDMGLVSMGLGAKLWVADHIALRLDLRDNMVVDDTFNNIEATLGIVFSFGGRTESAITKTETERTVFVKASEPQVEEKVKKAVAVPDKPLLVVLAFEDVHFDFDQSVLTKEAQEILKKNIWILKSTPKARIRIAGYTSASGTNEYNQKLSERRAQAVYDYVTKEGLVPQEKLAIIGYGEKRPAEYEQIPENIYSKEAQANMRVLFQIVVK